MKYRLALSIRYFSILIVIGLVTSISACKNESGKSNQEPKGRTLDYTRQVTFLNQQGESITTIDVAVADDNAKRTAGLMDVNELPADKGMLFIFENESQRSFWMANTPLSLDIIFVNAAMEIVRIHQNTPAFTQQNFTSENPAQYVVETNAGFCLSHDIQEGMKIKL